MNRLAVFLFIFSTMFLGLILGPIATGITSTAQAQSFQSDELALDAEWIVYYTNMQRRANGLAPLKISRDLTEAALIFAEDAVVNLGGNYCGHTDSLGRTVGDRLRDSGLIGAQMWGENVVCGLMSPQDAVNAWMESAGHRENILTADFTEIGVGHFEQGNAGYIVQNFALDINTSPVIIDNESPSTTSPTVSLYIYDHHVRSGMAGLGAAVEMMISNQPNFAGATWQPFAQETSWTLEAGEGRKRVYVATRDADGRRSVRFDEITLGNAPTMSLSLDSYPSVETNVTHDIVVSQLPEAAAASHIQLSQDWEMCETDETSQVFYGTVDVVDDDDAHGGQAFRMAVADQRAYAAVWTTDLIAGQDMIAYVRIKVEGNQSENDVVSVEVRGDGTTYASSTLKASDFVASGVYQEIPLRFRIPTDFKPSLVEVHVQQKDAAVLYFDGVTFFTDSLPLTSDFHWSTTNLSNRDRGLRIRTVSADGTVSASHLVYATATTIDNTVTSPVTVPVDGAPADDNVGDGAGGAPIGGQGSTELLPSESHVTLLADQGSQTSIVHTVGITCSNCPQSSWSVNSTASWLSGNRVGDDVEISVNAAGLSAGQHTANLTVTPNDDSVEASAEIQVIVTVLDASNSDTTNSDVSTLTQATYLPLTMK